VGRLTVRFGVAALCALAACDTPAVRDVPAAAGEASAATSPADTPADSAAATAAGAPALAPQSITAGGQTLTVQFDVRCTGGQTTQMALLVSGAPPMKVFEPSSRGAMSTMVTVSIDGRAPLREPWTLTGDGEQIATAPSAVDVGMQLRGATRLRVTFQPYGAKPTSLEWDLVPLQPQLTRTARECQWPI
jgi:hypothetical protein